MANKDRIILDVQEDLPAGFPAAKDVVNLDLGDEKFPVALIRDPRASYLSTVLANLDKLKPRMAADQRNLDALRGQGVPRTPSP